MWLVCTGSIAGSLPFRLKPGDYIVGRTKTADVIVKDSTLSRRHALLSLEGECVTIKDLKSLNGTFINEHQVDEAQARLGDRIRFGSVTCMLCSAAIIAGTSVDSESTFAAAAPSGPLPSSEGLTLTQCEVLQYVLKGYDESQIAEKMGRSWHTIHTHLKAIYKHYGVHSRVELLTRLLPRPVSS
jgi:DNA-binding CsgD family transcriptional regulator